VWCRLSVEGEHAVEGTGAINAAGKERALGELHALHAGYVLVKACLFEHVQYTVQCGYAPEPASEMHPALSQRTCGLAVHDSSYLVFGQRYFKDNSFL
jgi:hypothetical protein